MQRMWTLKVPGHQGQGHGQGAHALTTKQELGIVVLPPEPEEDTDAGRDQQHEGEDDILLPTELADQRFSVV